MAESQPWGLVVVTAPTELPVTLPQARARLRVVGTDEDGDITAMIEEATELAQAECGSRQFCSATFRLVMDRFPANYTQDAAGRIAGPGAISLPRPPCASLVSVKYRDTNGTLQTLSGGAYILANRGEPARVYPTPGTYWPETQSGRPECVEVEYVAGYGGASAVPRAARAAILEIVAHSWARRGDEATLEIPPRARRMLDSLEFGGLV